ncbi:MAG: protein SCO1/2 [Planctomycetota bacterium]|jgi:protein SCO1/2
MSRELFLMARRAAALLILIALAASLAGSRAQAAPGLQAGNTREGPGVSAPVGIDLGPIDQRSSLAPLPNSPKRFSAIPDFSFIDADERAWTRADLLGEPWVMVLFFTSCSGPCPRLSADVRSLLHDQLADTDVRIVSLSVDPEYDRPEVLREYAQSYEADPERWVFLTGDENEIHGFIRNGLKLGVGRPAPEPLGVEQEAAAEAATTDGEMIARLAERMQMTHSTRLVAVDPEGVIAGWYECGDDVTQNRSVVEESFADLLDRLRLLDGARPARVLPRSIVIPTINAVLNATAALCLLLGLGAIRRGDKKVHEHWMIRAFLVSAAFLVLYVYYHVAVLPISGGPTKFNATGVLQVSYLVMLASHVILAAINLPMVLRTFWLAHRERWDDHKRWARWTFPIWLYVSVTGVLVYLVLYVFNPA